MADDRHLEKSKNALLINNINSLPKTGKNSKYKCKQVAQLSLTNPRDTLHHGKRKKFLNSQFACTISTFGVAFHFFVAGNRRHFKFNVLVEHSKSQPTDDKLSLKGAWSLSRDLFNYRKISDTISQTVQDSFSFY